MTLRVNLAGIACHVPDLIVTNDDLQRENPDWDMARIASKTGIFQRHIAAPGETAADLGYAAATKLFEANIIERRDVDYLLYCTQSPDYVLPTTACVLQDRLALPTTCAALDFNQGCSGYIYGLSLARSLILSGDARNVLLITAETYSKWIHPRDRSVRVLFGDAGAATLISGTAPGASVTPASLGTDGTGYANLIVPAGGARTPRSRETAAEATDDNGSTRSADHLYMNGQELFTFTLKRVPEIVDRALARAGMARDDVRWFIFHQANAFMNEHLRTKLKVPKDRAPLSLARVGNTVSSTIPFTICASGSQFREQDVVLLVGFGVGYSWGACALHWSAIPLFPPEAMLANDAGAHDPEHLATS